jgi:hypothetical protein
MNQTDNQLLRDPNISPTAAIIAEGLGEANNAFTKFISGLSEYGISLMDWRYYNDGKAWLSKGEYKWTTTRGTNKVKPIFWLSIWDGFFKVSFFFSYDLKDDLLSLPLSAEGKDVIKNTKPMGKTARFMPVILDITNEMQLSDIFILAEFRQIKVK